MVSYFLFVLDPYLGKIFNLTNIFHMGFPTQEIDSFEELEDEDMLGNLL